MRFVGLLAALVAGAASLVGEARGVQTASGRSWAIASGHPRATEAGAAVLRAGGNAVDAAVAASLTLGVAEPYGSGLGGKLVMLHRDGVSGDVTCIEALCPSAAATDPGEFASLDGRKRKYGYRSVCVPGLPAGLYAAHERWGSTPWESLTEPAVRLARGGLVVNEAMKRLWKPHRADLAADPEAGRLYLVDGDTPEVGARLQNAELAETLERLGKLGAKGFYEGPTAQRIVAAARAAGSPLTEADFAEYRPHVVEPLAVNYRGYRVYSCPPPVSGGGQL